jgi:hypothetical protein
MRARGGLSARFLSFSSAQGSIAVRRMAQAALGGIPFNKSSAPATLFSLNLLVLFLPFVVTGIFTLVIELEHISELGGSIIAGVLAAALVAALQLWSIISLRLKKGQIQSYSSSRLEDEDVFEYLSLFDITTLVHAIPPRSLVSLLLHTLASGLLCGGATSYLLPTHIGYFYNAGATAILFITGWLSVLIAQYSLTSRTPYEPAVFRAAPLIDFMPFSRPFYVAVLIVIFEATRESTHIDVNRHLYVLLSFYPLLWTAGVLPPVDAMLTYACEQYLVFGLGGSFQPSDLATFISASAASIVFGVAYHFLDSDDVSALVTWSSFFGILLSFDWGRVFAHINSWKQRRSRVGTEHSALQGQSLAMQLKSLRLIFLQAVLLVAVTVISTLLSNHSDSLSSNGLRLALEIIIGHMWSISMLHTSIGSVYLSGLFRNPLFEAHGATIKNPLHWLNLVHDLTVCCMDVELEWLSFI